MIKQEFDNMSEHQVWDVVERKKEDTPLTCVWVFKEKIKPESFTVDHKARL